MAGDRTCSHKDKCIKIDRLVIVEGKYDKIKLQSVIDAEILITGGFSLFKDKEKREYIKGCANSRGILIVTDSDNAGFKIRNFVRDIAGDENVINCYIPEIKGKEARKEKPSAEGTLGVEGVDVSVIKKALEECGAFEKSRKTVYQFETSDLYELGLIGAPDSGIRRDKIKKELSLPKAMNNTLLLKALSYRITKEELENLIKEKHL